MSLPRASRVWILLIGCLVLAQCVVSLLWQQGPSLVAFSDVAQCILLASGAVALLWVTLRTHARTRLFWSFMSLGMILWLSYQMVWTYVEVVLGHEVPDPYWADIVIFLHIVPMMAALALQPHIARDQRVARMGSLDFSLLLVWWIYLYVFTVIPWQYVSIHETAYDASLNFVYMTEKLAFLGGLLLLRRRSEGSWRMIYTQWFGASLTYALSSYVANWALEQHLYHSGSLYDIPLIASMAWITYIGVRAASESLATQSRASDQQGVWIARLGMLAVLSLPLLAAWAFLDYSVPVEVRRFRLIISLLGILVMAVMVFLKQQLLDRTLLRLVEASQRSFDDLRRLQERLVQSEKLASLGQLVQGAAHELNNPIMAMMGYSELLKEGADNPESRELAEKLEIEVRRTREMVSSLLSFARQVPGKKSPIDLNALAQTVLNLSKPRIRAGNRELLTDFASGVPPVLGDSNQILQVCMYLTTAVLDRGHGPKFSMRTNTSGNRVTLEIFEEVQNMDGLAEVSSYDATGSGSGLGMGACSAIVREHSGSLMGSQAGNAFRLELPTVAATQTAGEVEGLACTAAATAP